MHDFSLPPKKNVFQTSVWVCSCSFRLDPCKLSHGIFLHQTNKRLFEEWWIQLRVWVCRIRGSLSCLICSITWRGASLSPDSTAGRPGEDHGTGCFFLLVPPKKYKNFFWIGPPQQCNLLLTAVFTVTGRTDSSDSKYSADVKRNIKTLSG